MKNKIWTTLTAIAAVFCTSLSFADGNVFHAKDFGAKIDGVSNDAPAIQKAIDAAAKAGGGTVVLDAGIWLSGTVYLKDGIVFKIDTGATLKGSMNPKDYNADDFCKQNIHSYEMIGEEHVSGAHIIVALNCKNVTICGGGSIDGNGLAFWLANPENKNVKFGEKFKYPPYRPAQMIFFCESSNIRVENISILNSPYWSTWFFGCKDVIISNLFIKNDIRIINGDGLDIDACENVAISNCIIESEDDCIAIRNDGSRLLKKANITENIAVTNCVLSTPRCNAFRIGVGSEHIKNCTISNTIIKNTRTGICFLTGYGNRGGVDIESVLFSNVIVCAKNPIAMYTDNIKWNAESRKSSIRGVKFSNCVFEGTRTSLIGCDKNRNISDITFDSCDFVYKDGSEITDTTEYTRLAEWGSIPSTSTAIAVVNAENVRFTNCNMRWKELKGQWKKALDFQNCKSSFADGLCLMPDCPKLEK